MFGCSFLIAWRTGCRKRCQIKGGKEAAEIYTYLMVIMVYGEMKQRDVGSLKIKYPQNGDSIYADRVTENCRLAR